MGPLGNWYIIQNISQNAKNSYERLQINLRHEIITTEVH